MKTIGLGAVGCVFLMLSVAAHAQSGVNSTGAFAQGWYQGKKYISSMPQETMDVSADFDLANTNLPKSVKEIAEIAQTQITAVTGSTNNWNLEKVTLTRAVPYDRKWYYALSFSDENNSGVSSNRMTNYLPIFVTIDGRLGVLKEVIAQETKTMTRPADLERAYVKILKVYTAQDGDAKFRAYVVKWKDQEIVVVDSPPLIPLKVGESICVIVRRGIRGRFITEELLNFSTMGHEEWSSFLGAPANMQSDPTVSNRPPFAGRIPFRRAN